MTESREGMVVRLSPSSTRRCVGVRVGVHVHAASSASSSHLSVLCSISAAVATPSLYLLPSTPFLLFLPPGQDNQEDCATDGMYSARLQEEEAQGIEEMQAL